MSLLNLIKRLQDVMRQDPGVDGDVQRLMQIVWIIFLKVFDYKEEENELDDDYKPVIPVGYRWRDWANPTKNDGTPDVKNALTGDDLISFVDNELMPVLKGNAININGTPTVVFDSTDDRALLVKTVMADAQNLMKNGYFLREVINLFNQVDLGERLDSHEFSEMYESLLDGLQAMGKYGEFHTPKAITRFAVDHVKPKLGQKCADWACGTGGFLVDIIDTLNEQKRLGHPEDYYALQNAVIGGEFKPMPYRLCITNMLLHGADVPNIRYGDSLDIKNFSEYMGDDLVDIACLNPPYGGVASQSDKLSFPANMRSSETADLFVALTVKRLKKNGRAIVVVPDGFLFGNDNAKLEVKKYLMKECNLHTIIRLPQSCFAPYTSIATNLLFFDKTGPTAETWFYRMDMPEGYKHFSKTKPIRRDHFNVIDEWWDNRTAIKDPQKEGTTTETWKSRKYSIDEIAGNDYNLDLCGYPTEEKIILSPEETIKNFIEKRNQLDKEMDEKLKEIMDLLGGEVMAHVLAKELREAVLQAAMSGKLTEQLPTDTPVEETLRQIAKEKEKLIKEKKIKKEKPLPEIDEDEVPFEIPECWKWVRMQNVLDVRDGTHDSPKYVNDGYPFITSKNLVDGKLSFDKVQYISKDDLIKFNTRSKVDNGDILMAMIGSIGKPVLVKNIDREFAIKNVALIKNIPNSKVDMNYVLYLLNYAENTLRQQAAGGVQQFVSLSHIRTFMVPFPPIEEQARIVAKVDELMAKIDEYEKLENQLVDLREQFPKDMKDSLLQAGMMGKLTEQLPTDTRIDKYYDAVMSEVKKTSRKDITTPLNDDLEDDLVDLPNNWMYARLNDLVSKEIRRGKSPKYSEVGTALAFAQKCNSKYSGIRLDLARCLSDSSLNRYSEEDNMHDKDIVINSTGGGTLGRVGLYEDKFNPNGVLVYPDSHVTVVRIKKTVNAMYIYYCIKQQSEYLETLGEGSTNQTELKPQSVKDLIIPLPPIEEQARIVTKLDQLLPLVESLEVN